MQRLQVVVEEEAVEKLEQQQQGQLEVFHHFIKPAVVQQQEVGNNRTGAGLWLEWTLFYNQCTRFFLSMYIH